MGYIVSCGVRLVSVAEHDCYQLWCTLVSCGVRLLSAVLHGYLPVFNYINDSVSYGLCRGIINSLDIILKA